MRIFLLFIILNIIAGKLAFAHDSDVLHPGNGTVVATVNYNQIEPKVEGCQSDLAKADADYQEVINQIRDGKVSQQGSYDNYLTSFNKMTEVLFQMTAEKEEETKKISESRDDLKEALVEYSQDKGTENSKSLQDSYMNLTVRLYSAMMDSQKSLESLKGELAQVESTRGQLDMSRQEMDSLDQKKLALEEKLINLKINCQK